MTLAAGLGLAACAHGTATTRAVPSAAPAVAARATPVPRRVSGPGSADVPAAAAPHTAAAPPHTAAVPPHTAAVPPRAAPRSRLQILGASVSPGVVRSGTVVRATVRTTPGVITVVAHAGGVALDVPRVGPGLFAGSTTIPPLPPFVHGSYPVTFVARDARGASTQSAVGVTVR